MLEWPFFEHRHRDFAAWRASRCPRSRGPTSTSVPRVRPRGWRTAGWRTRVARAARRAHALPRARDPRAPRRARGLRVRHAGARRRADHAVRRRRAARRATCRPSRRARRSRRSRCPSPTPARTSPAMATTAAGNRITGVKTWISNGGIADFYAVFARAPEGISAYVVDAEHVEVVERIDVIAPHPLATLRLRRRARRRRSARPGRACGSRSARSTSSARPSAPRRSGSRGGRWTRRSRA